MKTRFFVLMVFTIGLFHGVAQKRMDPQKMAEYQTEVMQEDLNLDEAQLEKIEELNLKYSKRQATLMNQNGSMFSKIGDMKKIKKEKNTELEKILSEEQMEKFEDEVEPKIRKKMKEQMSKS